MRRWEGEKAALSSLADQADDLGATTKRRAAILQQTDLDCRDGLDSVQPAVDRIIRVGDLIRAPVYQEELDRQIDELYDQIAIAEAERDKAWEEYRQAYEELEAQRLKILSNEEIEDVTRAKEWLAAQGIEDNVLQGILAYHMAGIVDIADAFGREAILEIRDSFRNGEDLSTETLGHLGLASAAIGIGTHVAHIPGIIYGGITKLVDFGKPIGMTFEYSKLQREFKRATETYLNADNAYGALADEYNSLQELRESLPGQ